MVLFLLVLGSLGVSEETLMGFFSPGVLLADALGFGVHDGQSYILIFGICSFLYGLPAYLSTRLWRDWKRG